MRTLQKEPHVFWTMFFVWTLLVWLVVGKAEKILCTNHHYANPRNGDTFSINSLDNPTTTQPAELCVHVWPDVGHGAVPLSVEVMMHYNFTPHLKSGKNTTINLVCPLIAFWLTFSMFMMIIGEIRRMYWAGLLP